MTGTWLDAANQGAPKGYQWRPALGSNAFIWRIGWRTDERWDNEHTAMAAVNQRLKEQQ